MPPQNEKSQLKRARVSPQPEASQSQPPSRTARRHPMTLPLNLLRAFAHIFFQGSPPADAAESKKPKINDAGVSSKTPVAHNQQLPTPGVKGDSLGDGNDNSATPPGAKTDEETPRNTDDQYSQNVALSSPPQDTQPATQFASHDFVSDEVEDEAAEGVWGYLQAWDPKYGDKPIVLKKRCACPPNDSIANAAATDKLPASGTPAAIREEEAYERTKVKGVAAGGYLIGRHAECGK